MAIPQGQLRSRLGVYLPATVRLRQSIFSHYIEFDIKLFTLTLNVLYPISVLDSSCSLLMMPVHGRRMDPVI